MNRQEPPAADPEAALDSNDETRPAESLTDLIDQIQRDAFKRSRPERLERGGLRKDAADEDAISGALNAS